MVQRVALYVGKVKHMNPGWHWALVEPYQIDKRLHMVVRGGPTGRGCVLTVTAATPGLGLVVSAE